MNAKRLLSATAIALILLASVAPMGLLANELRYELPDNDVFLLYFDYTDGGAWYIAFPGTDDVEFEIRSDRWIGLFSYDWSEERWTTALYFYQDVV